MITHITIKQLRELKGFNQVYVAEKLKITQAAYSKIESGDSKTSKEKYEILSNLLEVDVEYLHENHIPVFIYIDNKVFDSIQLDDPRHELTKSILNNIVEQRNLLQKILKNQ